MLSPLPNSRICDLCHGTREVQTELMLDKDGKLIVVKRPCPECAGTGRKGYQTKVVDCMKK